MCWAFERAVLHRLVYVVIKKADDHHLRKARCKKPRTFDLGAAMDPYVNVIASCSYSYAVVREAARDVQQLPAFASDPRVAKKKLSNQWIFDFLARARLSKQRATAVRTTSLL